MKEPQERSTDELDLYQLFEQISKFLRKLWTSFLLLIVGVRRVTKEKWLLIFILAILGAAAGYFYSTKQNKLYQSSMLLKSDFFQGKLIENSIEKLNLLANNENLPNLAKMLGINEESARRIQRIESKPFVSEDEIVEVELLKQELQSLKINDDRVQQVVDRVQLENKSVYEITVYVLDSKVIPNLEDAIASYFLQNPYLTKRLNVIKRNRLAEIKKVEEELVKLDSLKANYINYIGSFSEGQQAPGSLLVTEGNTEQPISVFQEYLKLFQKKLKLEENLETKPEFVVIDGFTAFSKAEVKPWWKTSLTGIFAGVALAYIFLFLIALNNYLNKIEKSDQE